MVEETGSVLGGYWVLWAPVERETYRCLRGPHGGRRDVGDQGAVYGAPSC